MYQPLNIKITGPRTQSIRYANPRITDKELRLQLSVGTINDHYIKIQWPISIHTQLTRSTKNVCYKITTDDLEASWAWMKYNVETVYEALLTNMPYAYELPPPNTIDNHFVILRGVLHRNKFPLYREDGLMRMGYEG